MRNRINITEPDVANNQKVIRDADLNIPTIDLTGTKPVSELLTAEGGESFFNYVDWLGLAKDPNLVVLSSMHHYYYDIDDLKEVKTVVNVLPLNQIKEVKSFFHLIYHLIPQECFFIGCFVDNKKHNRFAFKKNLSDNHAEAVGNDIFSRIPFLNMIYSIIDSRSNNYYSGSNVRFLLENYGFKVMDMTELNGLTYFCTQKYHTAEKDS